ncbi:hypothetical protein CK203_033830 [Vitis vinifera]|uniref:Uncharacterized protein n=1 Tax=Vitis vinifera TaxID=29760 RepID=A0A438IQN6_VITVI|nr:hypothetical protein CK203_033830 [Vitis vinifera]
MVDGCEVKGTLNVLRSRAKVPSIKRFVVISSMAAVAFTRKTLTLDVVVDETWFSEPAVCVKLKSCTLFQGREVNWKCYPVLLVISWRSMVNSWRLEKSSSMDGTGNHLEVAEYDAEIYQYYWVI